MLIIKNNIKQSNDSAYENSENQNDLKKVIESIEIRINDFAIVNSPWSEDNIFKSLKSLIEIKRGDNRISFDFFFSHKDATLFDVDLYRKENNGSISNMKKDKNEFYKSIECSLLACMKSDGLDSHEDFEDFCYNFGYSSESLKDLELYKNCCKQRRLVRSIFSIDEIESFPN